MRSSCAAFVVHEPRPIAIASLLSIFVFQARGALPASDPWAERLEALQKVEER